MSTSIITLSVDKPILGTGGTVKPTGTGLLGKVGARAGGSIHTLGGVRNLPTNAGPEGFVVLVAFVAVALLIIASC
jgi:hypothetical protein